MRGPTIPRPSVSAKYATGSSTEGESSATVLMYLCIQALMLSLVLGPSWALIRVASRHGDPLGQIKSRKPVELLAFISPNCPQKDWANPLSVTVSSAISHGMEMLLDRIHQEEAREPASLVIRARRNVMALIHVPHVSRRRSTASTARISRNRTTCSKSQVLQELPIPCRSSKRVLHPPHPQVPPQVRSLPIFRPHRTPHPLHVIRLYPPLHILVSMAGS
jgi:hypothetical protein